MMSRIKNSLKTKLFLASLFLVFSVNDLAAQDGFPDDVNDEPAVPVDGFIVAGLIAGSVLGIKKMRKERNK